MFNTLTHNSQNDNLILDTLRLDTDGFFLKNYHIDRTFQACQLTRADVKINAFEAIYNQLEESLLLQPTKKNRIRLVLNTVKMSYFFSQEEISSIKQPIRLELLKNGYQQSGCGMQNFKWEDRTFWNELLEKKAPSFDDILCVNTEKKLTETSRFNIFLYSESENCVYTPPLSSGCLRGTYREFCLDKKSIDLPEHGPKNLIEKSLDLNDLNTHSIFVANSIREVLTAQVDN